MDDIDVINEYIIRGNFNSAELIKLIKLKGVSVKSYGTKDIEISYNNKMIGNVCIR